MSIVPLLPGASNPTITGHESSNVRPPRVFAQANHSEAGRMPLTSWSRIILYFYITQAAVGASIGFAIPLIRLVNG